jgi:hypothetical protein
VFALDSIAMGSEECDAYLTTMTDGPLRDVPSVANPLAVCYLVPLTP